jgi:segregation and condensation protein A
MSYKVKLEVFEGPLDLLLYLIKREEIDIYDIPIAKITEQYLDYLNVMQMLDLNIAGEFLVMASTLIHIKSKMLLPPEERPLEEEEEDPRAELVRRLLEYKKFKEAAEKFEGMETIGKDIFTRKVNAAVPEFENTAQEGTYFEASLFDLISAFSKVLKEVPKEAFYEVIKDEFTVEEKIHGLLHKLLKEPVIRLNELFAEAKNKLEIITIFLAVLELIRLEEIAIRQKGLFGEIEIIRSKDHMRPLLRKV